jgi:3-dehydroquinate synthase
MVMAADLSVRLGTLDVRDQKRIVALIKAAGLPVQAPDLGLTRWMDLMDDDKKNEGGEIKFILLKPMGSAYITSVPSELLQETLKACG